MRPHRSVVLCLLVTASLTIGWSATPASALGARTATATVRVVAVDTPDTRPDGGPGDLSEQPMVTRALADDGGRLIDLPATVLGQATVLHSGDTVTVRTVPSGPGVRVTSVQATATGAPTADAAPGRVSAETTAVPVLGRHSLLILPVYWSTPDDATTASLSALAAATAGYWSEQSGGQIVISTAVRDWTRIADPGSCDAATIGNLALGAAGIPLPTSRFDHVMFYFPERADCGWAGLGQVGGSLIWDNGLQLTDITAHEFGHNLGLGHANAATCTDAGQRVTLSSSCVIAPYRDTADVMGLATYQATGNLNSALADWLQLARTVTAAPGERTTVTVVPLAQVADVRAVRIRVPTGWIYADYRPATGRDVRMPGWAGVQVHLLPDGPYPQSQLLDARPAGAAFGQVSLPVGVAWTVPGADLTLTVASEDARGAQLVVAPATAAAAVPVPDLTAASSGTPGTASGPAAHAPGPPAAVLIAGKAQITWRLSAPVAAVRLLVDGQLRTQSSALTSAGRAMLTGSFTLTGLTAGRHLLTAQAVDTSGRVSAPSATVIVTVDITPPSRPTGLALSTAGLLSWHPSTDATAGVGGYLVCLDSGVPMGIITATSRPVVTPAGRHTWSVTAVDRVGNVSAAGTVVVTSAALTTPPPAGTAASPRLRGTVRPQ